MITHRLLFELAVISICLLECSKYSAGSNKYDRYLAELFSKYGNGGRMTFEGLEHLMYNLGLGGLEFVPKHTIEEHHPKDYKTSGKVIDNKNINDEKLMDKSQKVSYSNRMVDYDGNPEVNIKSLNATVQENRNENIMDVNETKNLEGTAELKNRGVDIATFSEEVHELETKDNSTDVYEMFSTKIPFKVMHDPKHRHPRHYDDSLEIANRCLSPLALMKLVIDPIVRPSIYSSKHRKRRHTPLVTSFEKVTDDDNVYMYTEITPAIFSKICPALLVQIDQHACSQNTYFESADQKSREGSYVAWIYALVSVFIISCCGLFGVAMVPLMKSVAYQEILTFLVAVAVGTLCGDAFMHLLPHALHTEHSTENSTMENANHNDTMFICGCAFASAILMYILETLLPLLNGLNENNHGHSHQYFQTEPLPKHTDVDAESVATELSKELNTMLNEDQDDIKAKTSLSPVAFMVILGDAIHNLTDGLAIGAAFANDPVTGMATALAVLCHELPHELGDFALLIKTGVHINRALMLNVVSSIVSFIGMTIGLLLAEWQAGTVRWIYAGTAGSFLYIALTDLIPEMGRGGKHNLKNCLIQIFGIIFGGIIMLCIALHENHLRKLFEFESI